MLFGHASGKIDGQLRVDHAPVLPPSRPLFRDVHHRQIQHFQQAVICRENRFGLGYFAKLAVKTLNGIGGINQPPDFLRKLGIVPIMDSVAKTAYEFMPVYRSLTIRYILASMIMMLLWNRTILSELKSTSVKSYLLLGLCMASTFIFSNVVLHHTAATNVAFLLRCRSCSPLCSAIASTKNMLGRKSL